MPAATVRSLPMKVSTSTIHPIARANIGASHRGVPSRGTHGAAVTNARHRLVQQAASQATCPCCGFGRSRPTPTSTPRSCGNTWRRRPGAARKESLARQGVGPFSHTSVDFVLSVGETRPGSALRSDSHRRTILAVHVAARIGGLARSRPVLWSLVVLGAVGVILVAVYALPALLVGPDADLTTAERLKAENDVRPAPSGLVGAVLLSGLFFTARTYVLNREGQVTERFTRAIDQLGNKDASMCVWAESTHWSESRRSPSVTTGRSWKC